MSREFLSYDAVPYTGRIHYQSHVEAAATLATLFGMRPAPVAECRVLEIGCSDGANLLSMAWNLPGSAFVGVDGAASQIESGRKVLADLGVQNVTLHAMDLRDIGPSLGEFDYIVAHGIFSWIAQDTRYALLEVCRDRLKPQGVAYISYNCYPGWHLYEQLRGMMRFHSRGMSSIEEEIQQARAIIKFVGNAIIDTGSPRAEFFKQVLPDVMSMSNDYVYHEYLEENNQPMYFHEFIGMAMSRGLQYLGECSFHSMLSSNYPDEVCKTLDEISHNILELEQYMDFLRNRRFRCTLLCHQEIPVRRGVELDPIGGFKIGLPFAPDDAANDVAEDSPLQFTSLDDSETKIVVRHPIHKTALTTLAARWPEAVPFPEVAETVAARLGRAVDSEIATDLAELFMKLFSQSFAEFHIFQAPLTNRISARPVVTPLARYQALNSRVISTQRHDMIQLDLQGREVVARLDGERTLDQIADEILELVPPENLAQFDDPRAAMRESVQGVLERLAIAGVLIA